MRTANFVGIVTVLIVIAVCGHAMASPSQPDLKLVLAALSACIAAYSAWAFKWRQPDVRLVRAVPVSQDGGTKRLLAAYNDGALPTCFRVLAVTSESESARKYIILGEAQLLAGKEFRQFALTLASGDPGTSDRLCVEYAFYVGTSRRTRKATVLWEEAQHV